MMSSPDPTTTDLAPVRVHVVGGYAPPNKGQTSNAYSVSVANVIADGAPRQILPDAPNRRCATLIFSGTANDNFFLCSSQSEAMQKQGALVTLPCNPVKVELTDELWLAQGTTGVSPVVGVIAEYD